MLFTPLLSRWPLVSVHLLKILAAVAILLIVLLNTTLFSVYSPRLTALLWSDPIIASEFFGVPVLSEPTLAGKEKAPPLVSWTISGVFVTHPPFALLTVQGQTHVVRVGDLLFDGATVHSIRPDSVVLSYPSGERVLSIFSQQARS